MDGFFGELLWLADNCAKVKLRTGRVPNTIIMIAAIDSTTISKILK